MMRHLGVDAKFDGGCPWRQDWSIAFGQGTLNALRLYDPGRRPPDWNDQLHAGQCAVFLSDVKTGEEIGADGESRGGGAAQCYVFESLDEAKAFCMEMVARCEHAHAAVFDQRGRVGEPVYSYMHPKYLAKLPSEGSLRRRILLSWLMMIPSPFLFWWDYRHDLGLIWPTFIGINLIVIALRIRMWATGEREVLRSSAAREPAS